MMMNTPLEEGLDVFKSALNMMKTEHFDRANEEFKEAFTEADHFLPCVKDHLLQREESFFPLHLLDNKTKELTTVELE